MPTQGAVVALPPSEELFRTLADNISQLAWMADPNGSIFWFNRRWYEFTGTTLDEMQGWGWTKVHHLDHVERVVERIRHSWETGEAWEDTFPLRGRDGQFRSFLSRALPIRDEQGTVVCWFGTNTDVTAQLEVEQERERLLASERSARQRAEGILETALDGIITIDDEGKIRDFNPAAERMFGHSRADAVGQEVAELIIPPRFRKPAREVEKEFRTALQRAANFGDHHTLVVMVDDVDLVAAPGDALLQLRAIALELYATDIAIAFVVSASPGLFGSIRGAHELLVRFFEPITLGPLAQAAAAEAIAKPLTETGVTFDNEVVAEIVELSGGRPYYLQKLAYFAFDAAEGGRVGGAEFAAAFERAFASVSQEIFAARWSAMAPAERQVVSVVASANVARPSGEIEGEAKRLGIAPPATRQALRRLAARGHIDRHANGQRGQYAIGDRLFRRYLELQACER